MVIYVGGVSGVGKSTLLNHLDKSNSKFTHLRGSTLLMQKLNLKKNDYSSLRTLPDNVKNKAFGEIVTNLCNSHTISKSAILIDAHYLNFTGRKIHQVVGNWISNVHALILVEADSRHIASRITDDYSRKDRVILNQVEKTQKQNKLIQKYIKKERDEFNRLSNRYNLPAKIIKNPQGNIKKPLKEIKLFHQSLTT